MNLHPLVSLCAGAGLAGAIVVAGTVDLTPVQPGPPTVSNDERIQELALDVPNIARFDTYYGEKNRDQKWRNLNPFIPSDKRVIEKERSDRQDVKPTVVDEVPPEVTEPPTVREIGDEPNPDDFVPLIGADIEGFPQVVGVLAANRDLQLRVAIGAGEEAEIHAMRLGDAAQGWRLESVAAGLATFRNGQGLLYPSPLRVSGNMVMTVADAGTGGGGDASDERTEDEAPRRRRRRPEKPDEGPSDKELAEQVLKKLRSTEQGREALKRFPSLKDRIYDDPRQAQKMIERMMP